MTLFSPQVNVTDTLSYEFDQDILTIHSNSQTDVLDLTNEPEGPIAVAHPCVIEAYRLNGVLHMVILNYIPYNANVEDRFPEWIDRNVQT